MPAAGNLCDSLAGLPRVFSSAYIGARIDEVDKMMWNLCAFGSRRLGSADLEIAIHSNRIAVDDLAVELARKDERKRGLPASGWAEHDDEQRQFRWVLLWGKIRRRQLESLSAHSN